MSTPGAHSILPYSSAWDQRALLPSLSTAPTTIGPQRLSLRSTRRAGYPVTTLIEIPQSVTCTAQGKSEPQDVIVGKHYQTISHHCRRIRKVGRDSSIDTYPGPEFPAPTMTGTPRLTSNIISELDFATGLSTLLSLYEVLTTIRWFRPLDTMSCAIVS